MNATGIIVALSLLVVLLIATTAVAEDKAPPTLQTQCPVMGGKIDKSMYVDHDGKRIYVCCAGCINAIKKDPTKYIKKLEAEGITLEKRQTQCPVMGGKVNKNLYVDHNGKRIYVCCAGCITAVKKDPAKYIKKLEAEGVTLEKRQTQCPVMGGKINKKLYVDHGGKRIYVCCEGCINAVKKDAQKYVKTLEAEGITLDATPKKATEGSKKKPQDSSHEHH